MRLSCFALYAALFIVHTSLASGKKPEYPATKTEAVTDTLHGVVVADPYRWLENSESPLVRQWVADQNAFTREYLDKLPGREAIRQRLDALLDIGTIGSPIPRKGKLFFTRQRGKEEHPILYVRDGLGGADRVLIDPKDLPRENASLDWWFPSPDGSKVAYGVSQYGNEQSRLHVRDVSTGKDLPDVILFTRSASITWQPDSSGFFYTRSLKPGIVPKGEEQLHRYVCYHALGSDPVNDAYVFGAGSAPGGWPEMQLSPGGRWLVVTLRRGWSRSDVFFQDRSRPDAPFTPLAEDIDARFDVIPRDDALYVRTDDGAVRGKLYRVNPAFPDRTEWKEVLAQGDDLLQGAGVTRDTLAALYVHEGVSRLRLFDLKGKPKGEVQLPAPGSITGLGGEWDSDTLFFRFESFTSPPAIYRCDLKSAKAEPWLMGEASDRSADFGIGRVTFHSKDGTEAPMFLVHKKGLKRDGDNPTLIYAYGGFNLSMTPTFDPGRLLFLERGGVLAIPQVRGGGELGEKWHRAGMLGQKQNAFDDCIAAAEYLIREKCTRPEKLAVMGASNGGLLVGAVVTQRPELFRAAVAQVPILDMLRYHRFRMAWQWVPEYGSSEEADAFRWLSAYSPYHKVKDNIAYPAMLLTAAEADARVDPLHARKMAARLQAATTSERPILLREDTDAGHGPGRSRGKLLDELTDVWSFLLAQLDVKP
jgi:prolyl oligopeptidase